MLLTGACISTTPEQSSQVKIDIVSSMRDDQIKKIVMYDECILMFGSALLERIGKGKKHSISQKMRQLGRLVIQLREMSQQQGTLMKYLDGQHFDLVVAVTKRLCRVSSSTTTHGLQMLESPSLGFHLGHSLAKYALIKKRCSYQKKR